MDEAREQFALNQYLAQLSNPQIAFAVKQTKPQTVDDAVRATLEMYSGSRRRGRSCSTNSSTGVKRTEGDPREDESNGDSVDGDAATKYPRFQSWSRTNERWTIRVLELLELWWTRSSRS